jgi:two-component system response regulator ChvI
MSKIAIVDGDREILTSLSLALEEEGFQVAKFTDSRSALIEFSRKMPDLILTEVEAPRIDGFELVRKLRTKTSIPIAFLSTRSDEIDQTIGFRMGADDYILKPYSERVLLERVRNLFRRQERFGKRHIKVDEEVKTELICGDLTLDAPKHNVSWRGRDILLTVTQFKVLWELASNPGIVMSRDKLMDVIHGDEVFVDDRTIDSHIKRLRQILRTVDAEFNPIETLYGIGYRFKEGYTCPKARAA